MLPSIPTIKSGLIDRVHCAYCDKSGLRPPTPVGNLESRFSGTNQRYPPRRPFEDPRTLLKIHTRMVTDNAGRRRLAEPSRPKLAVE